jgi:hypothetical protein
MVCETVPNILELSIDAACDISLECWRLSRAAGSTIDRAESAAIRYAVSRISDALRAAGLETIDLTGRKYDAGMAPDVVDVVLDDTVLEGQIFIHETVSPIVTWRGRMIRPGQIIVRRSPLQDANRIELR